MNYILTQIIRGIIYLIPITVLAVIAEKMFRFTTEIYGFINSLFVDKPFIATTGHNLIIIALIIITFFIVGLISQIRISKKLITFIESKILYKIPGYNYMKSSLEDFLGIEAHDFSVVIIIRQGENFQIGFVVEDINDQLVVVFIPSVPKPRSGSVQIVDRNKITNTDLNTGQAFSLLRNMGKGAAKGLTGYLVKAVREQ